MKHMLEADRQSPSCAPEGKTFFPDQSITVAQLNKALADVFGEKGLEGGNVVLEINSAYWEEVVGAPWSGNIYKYSF